MGHLSGAREVGGGGSADVRAAVLLGELNAIERGIAPMSRRDRYIAGMSYLIIWTSVGSVVHWQMTHPLMLAVYGVTVAGAVVAGLAGRARRKRTEAVFARHEELLAKLEGLETPVQ